MGCAPSSQVAPAPPEGAEERGGEISGACSNAASANVHLQLKVPLRHRWGITFDKKAMPLRVTEVHPECTARSAGMRSGDVLLLVNGVRIESWRHAVSLLQEERHDGVKLELYREGGELGSPPVGVAAGGQYVNIGAGAFGAYKVYHAPDGNFYRLNGYPAYVPKKVKRKLSHSDLSHRAAKPGSARDLSATSQGSSTLTSAATSSASLAPSTSRAVTSDEWLRPASPREHAGLARGDASASPSWPATLREESNSYRHGEGVDTEASARGDGHIGGESHDRDMGSRAPAPARAPSDAAVSNASGAGVEPTC